MDAFEGRTWPDQVLCMSMVASACILGWRIAGMVI